MKLGLNRGRIGRLLLVAVAPLMVSLAQADEIHVASSGGFAAAYRALAPGFEAHSGHKLVAVWGPSMGETSGAIPKRLARGEADLGFQQVSELLPVQGIYFVGEIPDETQQLTPFSAGIVTGTKEHAAAQALMDYLTSAEAAPVIRRTGLSPAAALAH